MPTTTVTKKAPLKFEDEEMKNQIDQKRKRNIRFDVTTYHKTNCFSCHGQRKTEDLQSLKATFVKYQGMTRFLDIGEENLKTLAAFIKKDAPIVPPNASSSSSSRL